MGAFDGELARLGYKPVKLQQIDKPLSTQELARRDAVANMHLAVMPCPGSCGKVCSNHHCPAHNGNPYDYVVSFCARHRFSLYEKAEWLAGRFTLKDKYNWWRKDP